MSDSADDRLAGWEAWDTLAKRLKGSRHARKLTQEQLRKASGASQSDISKLERGEMLSTTRGPHLAMALKVDSYWLTTGIGRPTGPTTTPPAVSELLLHYQPVRSDKFAFVPVLGAGSGGNLPERIWTDGDFPTGVTNDYAEVISSDKHAFIIRVVGPSMIPKYNPGDYALVEPDTEPDLEDDVLVRLANGQTMIKRLLSRRGHIRLGSYNDPEVHVYDNNEITWMYYVAYPVPARKIKPRL